MAPPDPLPVPARCLAIGAHPDDIEFGCGATLAKWADAGCHVALLVLTDGSKGTWDPRARTEELVQVRMSEQRDAARIIGSDDVHFLGATDGELACTLAERERVCAVIRTVAPDVVLSHDPWKRYRLHPDHRNAGQLAIDGIVAARDPHFFPEQGLAPHRPTTLLLFEADEIDHHEPITEAHLARKIEALLAHRSQWRSTMHIDGDDADAQLEEFRARERAKVGAAGGSLAEHFKRIGDL